MLRLACLFQAFMRRQVKLLLFPSLSIHNVCRCFIDGLHETWSNSGDFDSVVLKLLKLFKALTTFLRRAETADASVPPPVIYVAQEKKSKETPEKKNKKEKPKARLPPAVIPDVEFVLPEVISKGYDFLNLNTASSLH